jgi:hypothetical protein
MAAYIERAFYDNTSPQLAIEDTTSNARSVKDFVQLIKTAWRRRAGDFIACGRYLVEAKAELANTNDYNAMLKQLDFNANTVKKLVCIGNDGILSSHVNSLPPCWSTLYCLTQLPQDVLKAAIADGRVHPRISRADAIALNPAKKTTAKSAATAKPSATTNSPDLSMIWKIASAEQRRAFLDQLGRAELCAAMSDALKADLRDRILGVMATKPSDFATYATGKFLSALASSEKPTGENDKRMGALLKCIIRQAEAKGIARGDIIVAARKPKARK